LLIIFIVAYIARAKRALGGVSYILNRSPETATEGRG
jgi:hypothetical protein